MFGTKNVFQQYLALTSLRPILLVYVRGGGIVINEPSVVAINQKNRPSGGLLETRPKGCSAERQAISAPSGLLIDGVISDYRNGPEMLSYFIRRVIKNKHSFIQTDYCHRRAFPATNQCGSGGPSADAANNSGGGDVYIVEEPMAAASGVEAFPCMRRSATDCGYWRRDDRHCCYLFGWNSFGQKYEK